jgi:hypothetical protein
MMQEKERLELTVCTGNEGVASAPPVRYIKKLKRILLTG